MYLVQCARVWLLSSVYDMELTMLVLKMSDTARDWSCSTIYHRSTGFLSDIAITGLRIEALCLFDNWRVPLSLRTRSRR